MGEVSISYSDLGSAKSEAKSVARKLDSYANAIERTIYNKLSGYDGDWTGNLSTAKSSASNKMNELRNLSEKYETYASDLDSLRDQCKDVDKTVKSRVSSLTASFKSRNGISNNVVVNGISYLLTSIGNMNELTRMFGDGLDMLSAGIDYLKEGLEDWYDYGGGKQILKGIATFALETLAAIAMCVAAVAVFLAGTLTFGAVLLLVASLTLGLIAAFNAGYNFGQECIAYSMTRAGDPGQARRESRVDEVQEGLRRSDNKVAHYIADAIDAVIVVCSVIEITNTAMELGKGLKTFGKGETFGKIKGLFSKGGLQRALESVKSTSLSSVKNTAVSLVKKFGSNLKGEYSIKTAIKTAIETGKEEDIKKVAKTVKNVTGIGKDIGTNLLNDGGDKLLQNVLKGLSRGVGVSYGKDEGGIDLGKINLYSIRYDIFGKAQDKVLKKGSGALGEFLDLRFANDSSISVAVPDNLVPKVDVSSIDLSDITIPDITIPDITIPEIHIPQVSVAF